MQVWQTSEADLGPLHTSNVGISGTVTDEWPKWVDSLVVPFHPSAVVIYLGANDLHNVKSPPLAADVSDKLARLFDQIHTELPDTHIYYVSVYTAGSLPELRPLDEALNASIEAKAAQMPYLDFIDVATALLDSDGNIRNDIFQSDLVHLNDEGYALWTKALREELIVSAASQ
jgi:lysophospholipase L1-like esterase